MITRKNERVSKVIDTLAIQAGEADSRDTAEAFGWARENGAELRSRWQEYSEEEPAAAWPVHQIMAMQHRMYGANRGQLDLEVLAPDLLAYFGRSPTRMFVLQTQN